jgi:putative ABC transport system permease protein
MRFTLFLSVCRQFSKDKVYSAINILGLAVGIASTILMAGYIAYELRYDRFYPDYQQIYRVYTDGIWSGKSLLDGNTAYPLADVLAKDYPEVQSVTRCQVFTNRSVRYGEKHFYEDRFFYADRNFVDFFGYKVLAGNPETMLSMPFTMVMTASAASRYFGNDDPLGKSIRVENNFNLDTALYTVTGIIEDVPPNSHLRIDMLASLITYPQDYRSDNWLGGGYFTYFRLDPLADQKQLNEKLNKNLTLYFASDLQKYLNMSIAEYKKSKNVFKFGFQPVASIHMNAGINDGLTVHGNERQIYILACIAVIILILACVNFTNLSTVKAILRAKEIGIRKISGAGRRHIAFQFLGEVFLHVFAATVLAVMAADVFQVPFARLMDRQITIITFDPWFITGLLILMFITTIAAGSYPAFLVSSMSPLAAIRGKENKSGQKHSFRTMLVMMQFILSIATAIAALNIYRQMIYLEKLDPGYNRSNVMVVERTNPLFGKIEPFIQDLKNLPEVSAVSVSSGLFGRQLYQSAYSREGMNPDDLVFFHGTAVDYEFARVYDLELKKGRWFSPDFYDSSSVVINETGAKVLGWDEPVGKRLFNPDGRRRFFTIIGVVKDFNYESMHTPIQPFLFTLNTRSYDGYFSVRFEQNDPVMDIRKVKQAWERYAPYDPLVYFYYEREFNRIYHTEMAARNLMLVFTILAVIISCFGLLGMASYTTGRRTKEVGIRKSFGASSISIVRILVRSMLEIVFVASLIAWPLAWVGTNKWLNDFAYRVHLNFLIPILVMAGALILCILTVGYHTLRVARSNPVDALRYE